MLAAFVPQAAPPLDIRPVQLVSAVQHTRMPSTKGGRGNCAVASCVSAAAAAWVAASVRRRRGARCAAAALVRRAALGGEEDKAFEAQCVDEAALLAESTFAIKPDDLIRRCKEVLAAGVGTKDAGKDFADDFEFCAPFVGPIGKQEYLDALGTFKLEDGFPDQNPRWHFFRVDPFEPNRVWFQSRKVATNTGEVMGKPATGKALTFPPETYSLRFNEEGKVSEFTVGYVIDRRVGNTGGLGGAFGYFYGIGRPLPFPECRPYRKSWQFRLLSFIGRLTRPKK